MTGTDVQPVYVRRLLMDAQPAPLTMTGPIGWLRANLFSSPLNTALTLLAILLIAWIAPPFARFLVIDATWVGVDREACLPSATRPEACSTDPAKWAPIPFNPEENKATYDLTPTINMIRNFNTVARFDRLRPVSRAYGSEKLPSEGADLRPDAGAVAGGRPAGARHAGGGAPRSRSGT